MTTEKVVGLLHFCRLVHFSTMKILNIGLLSLFLVLFGVVYSGGVIKDGIGSKESIGKLNLNYAKLASTLDKLVHQPKHHAYHGDDHPHERQAKHNDVNDFELELFVNLFNKIHNY